MPSSLAHRIVSSMVTAFCRSATPIVSMSAAISFARAEAARSTCIKYSLSPLVSPKEGLTGLVGFCTELTVVNLLVIAARWSKAGRILFIGVGVNTASV
jgi:hypothetical protein